MPSKAHTIARWLAVLMAVAGALLAGWVAGQRTLDCMPYPQAMQDGSGRRLGLCVLP